MRLLMNVLALAVVLCLVLPAWAGKKVVDVKGHKHRGGVGRVAIDPHGGYVLSAGKPTPVLSKPPSEATTWPVT